MHDLEKSSLNLKIRPQEKDGWKQISLFAEEGKDRRVTINLWLSSSRRPWVSLHPCNVTLLFLRDCQLDLDNYWRFTFTRKESSFDVFCGSLVSYGNECNDLLSGIDRVEISTDFGADTVFYHNKTGNASGMWHVDHAYLVISL